MSISDNQINTDHYDMISVPYDFMECNLFRKPASVKAVKILNQLNNYEKIILFQELAYGGYTEFYKKSWFWDLYIVTKSNNQYNYYFYCLEDYIPETKEHYIFQLKCYLDDLFFHTKYYEEYKYLLKSSINFIKKAESILIEQNKYIQDNAEENSVIEA